MSKKRKLSPEEEALWAHVTKSVEPLQPAEREVQRSQSALNQSLKRDTAPKAVAPKAPVQPASPAKRTSRPKHTNHPPIDHRALRKLRRGRTQVDASLDLHGLTQAQAHTALRGFITSCRQRGLKNVIIVTGKGGPSTGKWLGAEERGVLRRQVPHWLATPPLVHEVVGFNPAGPRHGGDGAIYVVLKGKG